MFLEGDTKWARTSHQLEAVSVTASPTLYHMAVACTFGPQFIHLSLRVARQSGSPHRHSMGSGEDLPTILALGIRHENITRPGADKHGLHGFRARRVSSPFLWILRSTWNGFQKWGRGTPCVSSALALSKGVWLLVVFHLLTQPPNPHFTLKVFPNGSPWITVGEVCLRKQLNVIFFQKAVNLLAALSLSSSFPPPNPIPPHPQYCC